MAYDNYGLVEAPLGSYIENICNTIVDSGGGGSAWMAAVVGALTDKGNVPVQKFVEDLHPQELFSCVGNTQFPAGSEAMKTLIHFVILNMHSCGFIRQRPSVMKYRPRPELTIDEVTERMITPSIPLLKAQDLKSQKPRWANFVHLLAPVIIRIRHVCRQRSTYVARLRTYAGGIAWRIAHEREVTQAEKSLLLLFASGDERALTQTEWDGNYVLNIPLAETSDPLVRETYELYARSTQEGPASRFRSFFSRVDGTQLCFYYGPTPTTLTVHAGFLVPEGPFTSYELQPVLQFPWTAESQMSAVAERTSNVLSGPDDPFVIPPPVMVATPGGACALTSLDEPDFRLFYMPDVEGNLPSLSEFDVEYAWKQMNRITSTAGLTQEAFFPGAQALFYDLGFKSQNYGGGQGLNVDPLKFPLLNEELSTGLVHADGGAAADYAATAVHINPGEWNETIIYPDIQMNRVVLVPDIDVSILFYREGGVTIAPAMRDQVLVPRSWLFEQRVADVDHIVGLLGLNGAIRKGAEQSISASHCLALLARFFPGQNLPSLNPAMLAASVL